MAAQPSTDQRSPSTSTTTTTPALASASASAPTTTTTPTPTPSTLFRLRRFGFKSLKKLWQWNENRVECGGNLVQVQPQNNSNIRSERAEGEESGADSDSEANDDDGDDDGDIVIAEEPRSDTPKKEEDWDMNWVAA
ncbi:GL19932 [Drosophila persimilis]|uniref:GL19932 n=1 Tax=Drosophila persimilis TaxID=7234 RepID=B4GYJ7_DROPE|nr:GL19932 [Drosophila persimilis]